MDFKSLLKQYIDAEENIEAIISEIERYETPQLILYEVLFLLSSKNSIEDILHTLKSGKMGWSNPAFDDVAFKQKEQDDFTISPFQVEEGVLKCPKCSGLKSFSYSKQTRSADEPMTTFATCVSCKHQWTYSG